MTRHERMSSASAPQRHAANSDEQMTSSWRSPHGVGCVPQKNCAATSFDALAYHRTSAAEPSSNGQQVTHIAMMIYPGFTNLEFIGPCEVRRPLPGGQVRCVWHEPGPLGADSRVLVVQATHAFDEISHRMSFS